MACDIQLINYLSGLLSKDLIVSMIIGRSLYSLFSLNRLKILTEKNVKFCRP